MSRTPARPTVALIATIALLAGGSTGGSASGPTSSVSEALLIASDMPPGFTGKGIKDATDFDIDQASFDANGGLDKADQVWVSDTVTGVEHLVYAFDFRMLFPDADAAQAYLDAAEPILGETISGITLQDDPPSLGDVTRLYAGSLVSGDVKVDAQDFLFRVGPIVAKEYIGGFGSTTQDALPIAQAAEARIKSWLMPPPTPTVGPPGSSLRQWALAAEASTEYGSGDWSANEATGAPNVGRYQDDGHAWAPLAADGTSDWIELTYPVAVQPTAVNIAESYGNGAVILVEGFDGASGSWVKLWTGTDSSTPDNLATFSPPIAVTRFATDRLRITLGDTVQGWSEIDAVELVGTVP